MESNLAKMYYEKFFPADKLFKWLKINECREISFTLENKVIIRYQTFQTQTEFCNKIKMLPLEKIDIGAIYDVKPEKNIVKIPQCKELVFDVDLTDYDRFCCTDKKICNKCIPLFKVSVELLEYILTQELGFKNLSFVFSGRRGLHCFVTDAYVMKFTEEIRGHIVSYIEKVTKEALYSQQYTKILNKYKFYLEVQGFIDNKCKLDENAYLKILYDKMFLKIDSEVTKSLGHLIKMPFCVHPSTLILSLPINTQKLDCFNMDSLIRVEDVLNDPNVLNDAYQILNKWINLDV